MDCSIEITNINSLIKIEVLHDPALYDIKINLELYTLPALTELCCNTTSGIVLENIPQLKNFSSSPLLSSFRAKSLLSMQHISLRNCSHIYLENLPNIQTLDLLSNIPVCAEVELKKVFALKHLSVVNFELFDTQSKVDLVDCCKLDSLRIIITPSIQETLTSINLISELIHLTDVKLESQQSFYNEKGLLEWSKTNLVWHMMGTLSLLPSLKKLSLTSFETKHFLFRSGFCKLEKLEMLHCRAELIEIRELHQLKTLSFDQFQEMRQERKTIALSFTEFTRSCIVLESLSSLTELTLIECWKSLVQMKHLPNLRNLNTFKHAHCPKQKLLFLDNSVQLQVLNLKDVHLCSSQVIRKTLSVVKEDNQNSY